MNINREAGPLMVNSWQGLPHSQHTGDSQADLSHAQTTATKDSQAAVTSYSTIFYSTTTIFTTVAPPVSQVGALSGSVSSVGSLSPSATAGGSSRNTSYIWTRHSSGPSSAFTSSEFVNHSTMHTRYSTSTTTIKTTRFVTLTTTIPPPRAASTSTPSSVVLQTSQASLSSTKQASSTISTTWSRSSGIAGALPTQPSYHEPAAQHSSQEIAQGPVSSHRAGVVAGGITGALAGLAVIVFLALICLRNRRRKQHEPEEMIGNFHDKGSPFPPARGLGIASTAQSGLRGSWRPSQRRGAEAPAGTATRLGPATAAAAGSHEGQSSDGTPQLPPVNTFPSLPEIEGGLIRMSLENWDRPYSRDEADPRSLHPSLLPLPLRVTNPDHSRPHTPRWNSSASIGPAAGPQPAEAGAKKGGMLGAALMKMKRTFSGDTVPRVQQSKSPEMSSAAATNATYLQPPPKAALGQPIFMRSSVIIAGGKVRTLPPSPLRSAVPGPSDTTSRHQREAGAPSPPSARSSPGSQVMQRVPDDPFATPSPVNRAVYDNSSTGPTPPSKIYVPYHYPIPASDNSGADMFETPHGEEGKMAQQGRPLPSPLQIRKGRSPPPVPSSSSIKDHFLQPTRAAAARPTVVSAFSTDTTVPTVRHLYNMSPAPRSPVSASPVSLPASPTPNNTDLDEEGVSDKENTAPSPTQLISRERPVAAAAEATQRTRPAPAPAPEASRGRTYLAPWTQHPPYSPPAHFPNRSRSSTVGTVTTTISSGSSSSGRSSRTRQWPSEPGSERGSRALLGLFPRGHSRRSGSSRSGSDRSWSSGGSSSERNSGRSGPFDLATASLRGPSPLRGRSPLRTVAAENNTAGVKEREREDTPNWRVHVYEGT